MHIQMIHDTETGKTQVHLLEAAWAVQDPTHKGAEEGSKLLVFGAHDDKFDVVIPVGPTPANNIASQLLTQPASGLVTADVHDIARLRNGREPHGS